MSIMKKFMAERMKALASYYDRKEKEDAERERVKREAEAVPPEIARQWIKEGKFSETLSLFLGGSR